MKSQLRSSDDCSGPGLVTHVKPLAVTFYEKLKVVCEVKDISRHSLIIKEIDCCLGLVLCEEIHT